MLLESDPAAAARQAATILRGDPGHDAASLLLAAACRRLGDLASAAETLEALTHAHPESALLQLELGRTHAAAGRGQEACAALERAVRLDDALADAWKELAAQRFLAGDIRGGDLAYLTFTRLARDPPQYADALSALNANRLEAAEAMVKERIRREGEDEAALLLLAIIAVRRGDDAMAEPLLRKALELAPGSARAREELARLWMRQGRIDEALPSIDRLLAADPHNIQLSLLKAEALRLAERHAEGLAIVQGLFIEQPRNAELWLMAGNLQRFSGHAHKAVDAYRRAIELRPAYGEAYWALSNLKTWRFPAQDCELMQQCLAASPSEDDAIYLQFALGKALEDDGRYAASFEHYAGANARARTRFAYDAAATTAFVRRFKDVFTREFFVERAAWGHASEEPIFIVGLPRSGSTLLEQILASHPQIEGTKELAEIPTLARELASRHGGSQESYPDAVASLRSSDIETFASRYLEHTQAYRPLGKPRFVDKMLGNFVSIGLIHLMFPRAVVIDSRRHPMACGFSCYKQLFNPGMNFAYDLTELGTYIKDYADLMQHVDAVLPGRVHRVRYEQLVEATDATVRELLAACRLPFEPQCLRHFENQRIAQTISSEQVRLPIYREGLEQWRHFEAWLGPLRAALGGLVEQGRNPP
jgi:predicted Zn-dependent protease